ncbi:MAG: DUF1800 family protein, partial [Planctomycetota bacterium]
MMNAPNRYRPFQTSLCRVAVALVCWTAAGCSGDVAPASGGPGPDPQLFLTEEAAVRFLNRATFGASAAQTARLRSLGPAAWVDDQIQRPPTLMVPVVTAGTTCIIGYHSEDQLENCTEDELDEADAPFKRHRAWWNGAIEGRDQLRQRVAFALSQILVISERQEDLIDFSIGIVDYNDRLLSGAFGSFRDLLGEIARNSAMGVYLGMVKNRKADPLLNTR